MGYSRLSSRMTRRTFGVGPKNTTSPNGREGIARIDESHAAEWAEARATGIIILPQSGSLRRGVRQWFQCRVSGLRGHSHSKRALIPKFPDEPKFAMVPPSTPDRLFFGRDLSLRLPAPTETAYGVTGCIFQNAIPPACCPTSTEPTFASAFRSYTSTLPGAAPAPSELTNA
jgi:hypothetical protein